MIDRCVQRPIAVSMAFLAFALLGIVSLTRLQVSLFPELTFPRITVLTGYPNAAPDEIENLVSAPLEGALAAVNGVKEISSLSQEGLSVITVDLEWGQSLERATINVRQKLDIARPLLPADAGESILLRHDPGDEPILVLLAKPTGLAFVETRDFLEASVRPHLERLPGVAAVSISGGLRREIHVEPSTHALRSFGLSLSEVGSLIGSAGYSFPIGHVKHGQREESVRFEGDFDSIADISSVLLRAGPNGQPLALGELTRIVDGHQDRRGSALFNGQPAIIVALRKEPGRNTVSVAAAVRSALGDINLRFGRELELVLIQDNSLVVSDSIASVAYAAALGIGIAFAVLLLFLRDLWTAMVIAISVPVAVLFTFACMFAGGVSLNVMSLGGLSLGIGMLVDNAIVVMESIAQEREEKPHDTEALICINGAKRVASSVTAATLTSLVVFLPIIFVTGLAGAIFRDLALTVSAALFASLLTALTLVPMLAAHRPTNEGVFGRFAVRLETRLGPTFRIVEQAVVSIREWLLTQVSRALGRPLRVSAIACCLSLVAVGLLLALPRSLFPAVDSGVVSLELELPAGADAADSEALLASVQAGVAGHVRHAVSFIGHEPDDLTSFVRGIRQGNASVTTFYLDRRKAQSEQFMRRLRLLLAKINVKAQVTARGDSVQEVLGEGAGNIRVEVESARRSDARAAVALLEKDLQRRFGKEPVTLTAPGLQERPETRYAPIRDSVAAAGLQPEQVARELQAAIGGVVPAMLRDGDRRFPIRVRLPSFERDREAGVARVGVRTADSGLLPMGALLSASTGMGPVLLIRRNQRRIEELTVRGIGNDSSSINKKLRQSLAETVPKLASGVAVRTQAANRETIASLETLAFAFILSAILIYQLLAGQFESLAHPISLTAAVPLMLVGVVPALFITANGLNISSAIGLVLSAGLVVNAGIVLYERIVQEQTAHPESKLEENILSAVRKRVRPILLTTLTTVLGMLPMAAAPSGGSSLQGAMAVTVIGALVAGTALTIVVFPCLFVTTERMLAKIRLPGERESKTTEPLESPLTGSGTVESATA